ncbi:MAG: hypothetical protein HY222_00555 [Thaumarchaeota archaeon]|nr:hypothetical protein [Nitrososphaerota archaeon]MBI3640877.1 hypothetical protein [Nitrososphaerota archaeon]
MTPVKGKKEFRANIEVLTRLANAFSEHTSLKKTHLHFVSRTDWNSFGKYINWLQDNNYIECKIEIKEEKYHLTEYGREMFNMILKLREHVKSAKL